MRMGQCFLWDSPQYWGKPLLGIITDVAWIMWFSSLAGGNRLYVSTGTVNSSLSGLFFLWTQVVFSCACTDCSQLETWAGPSADPVFCLCTALSFPVPCPANSSRFSLRGLSALSLQLREPCGHCLGSPFLHCGLEALNAVNWGNHRVHGVCFPALRNHYLLLPYVQRLKNLFCCCCCFRW